MEEPATHDQWQYQMIPGLILDKKLNLRRLTILTWRDFMNVQRRFRIPSERFRSFTRRITRKSLKNVTDTLMFSEDFSVKETGEIHINYINYLIPFNAKRIVKGTHSNGLHWIHFLQKQSLFNFFLMLPSDKYCLKHTFLNFLIISGTCSIEGSCSTFC